MGERDQYSIVFVVLSGSFCSKIQQIWTLHGSAPSIICPREQGKARIDENANAVLSVFMP